MLLAMCLLLPFLTGQIPEIGRMLSPMHIPVLISGFVCGPVYALFVGLIAPTLRFFLFKMPPLFPVGIAMTFELATYGLVSGLLYKMLPKKTISIYISLIVAMIVGRLVWGIAMFVLAVGFGVNFSWEIFLSSTVLTAIPALVLHIAIIPVIVLALKKARFIYND